MASSPGSDAGSGRPGGRRLPGAQRGWWLEDAVPGTVLRHPGGRTIDEVEHVWLAWVTHNASDVHGNADAASRGPWGQPLVLGALSAAVVIGLAGPAAGEPATGAAGWSDGWRAVRLTGTVVPGDTLRAESAIHAVHAVPGGRTGRVARTIRGLNQRGEVVVVVEEEREVVSRAVAGEQGPPGR
jgi:itaconyl-CoA hydratase